MSATPVLLDLFELLSFVRGHHVYQAVWTPFEGKVLQLQREPLNPKDRFAVVVCLDGKIVGSVPANLAPTFSPFLTPSQQP